MCVLQRPASELLAFERQDELATLNSKVSLLMQHKAVSHSMVNPGWRVLEQRQHCSSLEERSLGILDHENQAFVMHDPEDKEYGLQMGWVRRKAARIMS